MLRQSTYLEVRLPNIKHNINLIRAHYAPMATLIPMIKGDAYGHGLGRVAGYLADHCAIRNFGVASLGEGLSALAHNKRNIDTGRDNAVFVFSDTEIMNESHHHYYKDQNSKHAAGGGAAQLRPVLGTLPQLEMFCRHRTTTFKDTPLQLKLNTGMNRLGLWPTELRAAVDMLRAAGGVDVLLQHFSVSSLVDHSFTAKEYTAFQRAKRLLTDAGVEVRATSVANSGAIEQRIGVEETYVRPGLMLYGPTSLAQNTLGDEEIGENAGQHRLWDGKVSGYFYTKVAHHYMAPAGTYVGYGVTGNLVKQDAVVALLPIGYADGFLRYYANMPITLTPAGPHGDERYGADGKLVSSGESLTGRVHGNVNMDLVAVATYPSEVGKDLDTIMRIIKDDSEVLVWGQDIGAKSDVVKSIPYQLMCGLSTRVPRRYVE